MVPSRTACHATVVTTQWFSLPIHFYIEVVLVGEYQHLIVGIISGQFHVKISCIACMWHVLVMFPMNLHVLVAADKCMNKNKTVANTVLMY